MAKKTGLAMIALLMFGAVIAQDKKEAEIGKPKTDTLGSDDEIVIRPKSDKNAKITVEIRDGQVYVNGKSADDYADDAVSVEIRKMDPGDMRIAFAPRSPFRGNWNFRRNDMLMDSRGFLGVSTVKSSSGGVEITEVTKESAAEKAGLKKGDVITQVDASKIEDPEDLVKAVRSHKPDDKVVVTFKREGKEQKATAVLGKNNMNMMYFRDLEVPMPPMPPDDTYDLMIPKMDGGMMGPRPYVMALRGPRIGIRAQDLESGNGVKVLDVDEDSPADKAGIKEGDIITQYDGKNITSASQLAELARANGSKSPVKMKITRSGKQMDIQIKITKKLKTAEL